MREIKFRFYSKKHKQMYRAESLFCRAGDGIFDGALTDFKRYDSTMSENEEVAFNKDEDSLMQYTGLKDRNGKDIYEADILHVSWYNFGKKNLGIHKGFNEVVKWEISEDEGQYEDHSDGFSGFKNYSKKDYIFVEVIGNIFENPELLKTK